MIIGKNHYFFRSHISEVKFKQIIRYFCTDLTAQQISNLTSISRQTINKILKEIRHRISVFCDLNSVFESGEVELDESYFGARRVRGRRGRGALGKTVVFGIKKRDGKVYTQVIRNCSRSEILPLIRGKISKGVTLYTDGFKTYDSLVDMGYNKHYRINHGCNEFAKRSGRIRNHINGIENFWGLAKVRLFKFRGMSKETFYLHLKECEFRFNYRHEDMYKLILDLLKKNPLKLS